MIALDIYRTWRDQWQKKQKKRRTGKDLKNGQLEGNKEGDESDDDDNNNIYAKHGIDRIAPDDERAAKKVKSSNSTPDPAMSIPAYAVPPQMVWLWARCVIHTILITFIFYETVCYSQY